jgi:hypothetical protein
MTIKRAAPESAEQDGFRPEADEYKVTYDRPGVNGLIAHFDDLSIQEALDMDVLLLDVPGETAEQTRERQTALYAAVADHLLDWNLLHPKTGEPVPCTTEGLMSMGHSFVGKVIAGYFIARRGVPAPLDDGSTSGEPFPEGSIPMETL